MSFSEDNPKVEGAVGGLKTINLISKLKDSLEEEAEHLDLGSVYSMVKELYAALGETIEKSKKTSLKKERPVKKKDVRIKNDGRQKFSSSSGSDDDVFESDSKSNNDSSPNEKRRKKRKIVERCKTNRKYTVEGTLTTDSDSDDNLTREGSIWLKRLVELEDSGLDTFKAASRIMVVLAGEMLEIFRSTHQANIRAVKPLKYGKEKIRSLRLSWRITNVTPENN